MSPRAESAMNDQVAETAENLLRLAAGGADTLSAQALRQAAAQTGAMMLQDAADHLRRTQILAEAATARALADLTDGKGEAQAVIDAAQSAVSHAIQAQAETSDAVAKLMANLPGGAETG
ncbi:MAG: hypothetical protein R8L07_13555 [Alphaproteobacteria bacterium]|nr:hypothetical protein [Alphaproteobacteria bacterium]